MTEGEVLRSNLDPPKFWEGEVRTRNTAQFEIQANGWHARNAALAPTDLASLLSSARKVNFHELSGIALMLPMSNLPDDLWVMG